MSVSELYRAVATAGISPSSEPALKKAPDVAKAGNEFRELLKESVSSQSQSQLNLSQHAETRIRSRSIPWNEAIEKRILGGIDQADAKGSREALILADNLAVIANVKSRTVVTAMDRSQMKDKIFTNIDSAVLV